VQPRCAPGVDRVIICGFGTYAVYLGSSLFLLEWVESHFLPPAHTAIAPPEPHRSTLDPDRGYYGEAPVGPACDSGGLSDGIAGCLILVTWQQHPKGFSASHWQPGTCGADAALHLDCAKSLLEVHIRIPGSAKRVCPFGGFGRRWTALAGKRCPAFLGSSSGLPTPNPGLAITCVWIRVVETSRPE